MSDRVLALVDGEHYPPVVRAALLQAGERSEVVAALLLGGSEKLDGIARLRGAAGAGRRRRPRATRWWPPRRATARPACSTSPTSRCWTSARGSRWPAGRWPRASSTAAPDFALVPAAAGARSTRRRSPSSAPASGSARRPCRGHVARVLARARLGRGRRGDGARRAGRSRSWSTRAEHPVGVADLLARARAGEHAASDFLEDAVLAQVTTVGARRCGGGLAGAPYLSNVAEARAARGRPRPGPGRARGLGRGGAAGRGRPHDPRPSRPTDPGLGAGFGAYRLLLADLVVLTMCDAPAAASFRLARARASARRCGRTRSSRSTVQRVAFFTTAARPGCRWPRTWPRRTAPTWSPCRARCPTAPRLRADLDTPEVASADVYLVEIKAAAIDVVAEAAAARGRARRLLRQPAGADARRA